MFLFTESVATLGEDSMCDQRINKQIYLTSINFIKCFYGFIHVSVLQEGLRDPDVPDRCHRGHRRAVYIP